MALKGVQVLEIAGLAPGPFCGMVLADFGARVIRIDKLADDNVGAENVLAHGKQSVALNFKTSEGIDAFKRLSSKSDVVIDPFRPGVMERLKIGPSDLMGANKRLIFARLTGFGQEGPLAQAPGHDINYVGLSGVLSMLGGRNDAPPYPPINLLADFAGGGLTAALGIILALFEREKSGVGQVVDCSMTRGAAYVSSWALRGLDSFLFCNPTGKNLLDGGSFFYNTYKTKDGRYMAVGSLEYKFYQNLLKGLNISEDDLPQTTDYETGHRILEEAFAQQTQAYWSDVFKDVEACVTPVVTPAEAAAHRHSLHQQNFAKLSDGSLAPTPEPRLSRTPGARDPTAKAPRAGQHTIEILKSVGYSTESLEKMLKIGAIGISDTSSKL